MTSKAEVLSHYRPLGPWDVWWRKLLLLVGLGAVVGLCFGVQHAQFQGGTSKMEFLFKMNGFTSNWFESYEALVAWLEVADHDDAQSSVASLLDDNVVYLQELMKFVEEYDERHRYGAFLRHARRTRADVVGSQQRVRYMYGLNDEMRGEVQRVVDQQHELMLEFVRLGAGEDLVYAFYKRHYRWQGGR